MRRIRISDVSMKQNIAALTFRERIELVKLLDSLEVDVIETFPVTDRRMESLCVKSIADTVRSSTVAVPCSMEAESIMRTWDALQKAVKPRLQIPCPVSSVQMEYLYHAKPDVIMKKAEEAIKLCASICADVEFIAEDATRADETFLYGMLKMAIAAGAGTVTVCDTAGTVLPGEFRSFIEGITEAVSEVNNVTLGVSCSSSLSLADICGVEGACAGAGEIKASVCRGKEPYLKNITDILVTRGETLGLVCGIQTIEIDRVLRKIDRLFTEEKNARSPFEDGVRSYNKKTFNIHDDLPAIIKEVRELGYDLSEEDYKKVYEAFRQVASRKDQVSSKELDAMVASAALQVPPTYVIESFIINSGNTITSTCHMQLMKKDGKLLESVSLGDGPVDAAFLAIEQITGHHYELDDFRIRSVTEGREAIGETVVRLRSGGKLYSGLGHSTDIIGSSIRAYISALNKIVYEEENA